MPAQWSGLEESLFCRVAVARFPDVFSRSHAIINERLIFVYKPIAADFLGSSESPANNLLAYIVEVLSVAHGIFFQSDNCHLTFLPSWRCCLSILYQPLPPPVNFFQAAPVHARFLRSMPIRQALSARFRSMRQPSFEECD